MTHKLDDVLKALHMAGDVIIGAKVPMFEEHEQLSNAFQTLRAFIERDKWRPISEALKDGTDILIGGYVDDIWEQNIDRWYQDREMGDWEQWGGMFDVPPTHFKYLSAPPTKGE